MPGVCGVVGGAVGSVCVGADGLMCGGTRASVRVGAVAVVRVGTVGSVAGVLVGRVRFTRGRCGMPCVPGVSVLCPVGSVAVFHISDYTPVGY
ncbi:hypothetical protein APR08_002093 [Nocardia amikacinitolerans]|nr:hypothetical protein [Nocardia amikacinitolerans]